MKEINRIYIDHNQNETCYSCNNMKFKSMIEAKKYFSLDDEYKKYTLEIQKEKVINKKIKNRNKIINDLLKN